MSVRLLDRLAIETLRETGISTLRSGVRTHEGRHWELAWYSLASHIWEDAD